jgi:hypothetical protein
MDGGDLARTHIVSTIEGSRRRFERFVAPCASSHSSRRLQHSPSAARDREASPAISSSLQRVGAFQCGYVRLLSRTILGDGCCCCRRRRRRSAKLALEVPVVG